MTQYRCILTNVGLTKQAQAMANNTQIKIVAMALGDGNNAEVTLDPAQTALVREVRREQITRLYNSADRQITVEQFVPIEAGGWWIYELGLIDEYGDLIAVANVPPVFKPAYGNGAARSMIIRTVIAVASSEAFDGLLIDPSISLVTVQSLDTAVEDLQSDISQAEQRMQEKLDALMPLVYAAL